LPLRSIRYKLICSFVPDDKYDKEQIHVINNGEKGGSTSGVVPKFLLSN